MTSPHQDAAVLPTRLRRLANIARRALETGKMVSIWSADPETLDASANLIEQQAKALSETEDAFLKSQTNLQNALGDRDEAIRQQILVEARLDEAIKVIEPFANLATRYDDMIGDGWIPWVEFLNEEAWPSEEECAAARSFLNSASNREPR